MPTELTPSAYVDALLIASRYVNFQGKPGKRYGGEYHGACPLPGCSSQNDAFMVWPYRPRSGSSDSDAGPTWYCRRCGETGDIIRLVMLVEDMHFTEACELVEVDPEEWSNGRFTSASSAMPRTEKDIAPSDAWQERAKVFAEECRANLWHPSYQSILDYLKGRGLTDATIRRAGLGYNPVDRYEDRALWGVPEENGDTSKIFLPQGIVIPWQARGCLWQLKIRRPKGSVTKYWQVKGSSQGIYNADSLLRADLPSCLLESEFDAMLLEQEAGALCVAVATGGTEQAQKAQWVEELDHSPFTLVSTDVGDKNGAGDAASLYWLRRLNRSVRYTPVHHDVTDSHTAGVSVRRWVELGIRYAQREFTRKPHIEPATFPATDSSEEDKSAEMAAFLAIDLPVPPAPVEMRLEDPPLICRKCREARADKFVVHPLRGRWQCRSCGQFGRPAFLFPVESLAS